MTAVPVRLQTHPSPLVVIRGGGGGNMSYRLTNGFAGYPKVLPGASSPQHRLFETESNRLNHFYNQLTTIKNGGHVNGHTPMPPAHDPATGK